MEDRPRDYPPGELIPGTKYKVVRTIGAGGMGTVYDVEDTTVGKRYVLKTLHPELCNRKDLAKRMEAEARTLVRLAHINIVEVMTAGTTKDALELPYYVMEKLNGQNLRHVLAKRVSLELHFALHIAIDLLDALEHAHNSNVIHRDVKPDNIFLHKAHGGVTITKLLDFGIMRMLDAGPGLTAGRFMGTLRYAAPEQLRGETVTPQTDLYAAGLVLYEMIAGRGPFDDLGDQHKIASAHLTSDPPPLMKWGAVCPQTLEKLIRSSLSKNPDKRPKDAFTFAAQLRNYSRIMQEPAPQPIVSQTGPTAIPLLSEVPPTPRTPDAPPPPAAGEPLAVTKVNNPEAHAPTEHAPTAAGAPPSMQAGRTLQNASSAPPTGAPLPTLASVPGPAGIDRNAPTHSMAVAPPPQVGPEGTEPIPLVNPSARASGRPGEWRAPNTLKMEPPPGALAPPPYPMVDNTEPDQLLNALPGIHSPAAPSDVGASSTIPAPERRSPAAALAIGVIGTGLVLGAVTFLGWRIAHRGATGSEPSAPPAATDLGAAPTIAPPLFDEVPSASAAPGAPPPASASAAASDSAAATVAPLPPPIPTDQPIRPSRPRPAKPRSTDESPPSPPPTSTPKRRVPGSGL